MFRMRSLGFVERIGNRQFLLRVPSRPGSEGGLYRIAFPLADETTNGHTNRRSGTAMEAPLDNAMAGDCIGKSAGALRSKRW